MSEAQAPKQHQYATTVIWTGDRGGGARTYRGYDRSWDMAAAGQATAPWSNDPLLGGDPTEYIRRTRCCRASPPATCSGACTWPPTPAWSSIATDSPLGVGETAAEGAGRFLRATLHRPSRSKRVRTWRVRTPSITRRAGSVSSPGRCRSRSTIRRPTCRAPSPSGFRRAGPPRRPCPCPGFR